MHLMKFSPLALLVAGLMSSGSLLAAQWQTVAARATAADGYEVRAHQYRVVGRISIASLPLPPMTWPP